MIAIIAVLAGMLLPVLRSAKAKGRSADCVSRLRQWGMASHMYLQENEDWLPPIAQGLMPDVVLFSDLLLPHLGARDMWLCPSGERDPGRIDSGNGEVIHYGVNHYWYDDVDGDGIENHLRGLGGKCLRRVAAPESVVYIADADPDSSPENIGGAQNGTTIWPLTSLAERRHLRGYNAVFLGGSVRWHPDRPNHKEWAVRRRD